MLSFAGAAKAADYDWRPVRVVDGDTIEFDASSHILVPELANVKVRARGVDTPETWRPECEAERDAGEAETAFVKDARSSARSMSSFETRNGGATAGASSPA